LLLAVAETIMSDHLDFIRIRGLEDSSSEVFQGIAAETTGIGGGMNGPAAALPSAEAAQEASKGLWEAVVDLVTGLYDAYTAAIPPPETTRDLNQPRSLRSRQLALPAPSGFGWLVKILTSSALMTTGGPLMKLVEFGLSSPGAMIGVAQVAQTAIQVMEYGEEIVDDWAVNEDRNRLLEILEKALLRTEGMYPFQQETSLLGDILSRGLLHLPPNASDDFDNLVSTLKTGLLELITDPDTQNEELRSYLAHLTDEQWRDLELCIGDDIKIRLKGRTLHF
jgi:hypothetical protein